nr:MAG TPA: helix-turn-helix domain protein [Caudoviricetes sp.]
MCPLVYTIKDVAELLQCSESSVNNLRERGILREIKDLPGVRFNKKDVDALVGIVDEYSPLQYRKLERERDSLLKENEKLKNTIRKITSDLLVMVGGDLKL